MAYLTIYRPSLRGAGAIAVLCAWAVSLGWLAVRQFGGTEDAMLSNEATLRLAPGTAWYALYAGSVQVGNAGITLDTLSPGYRVSEAVILETRDGTVLAPATWRTDTWLGATLNLERLYARYIREGRQTDWAVTISGDTITASFAEGMLHAHGRVLVGDPPTTAAVLPYRLALGSGLQAGHSRAVTLLDSWPMAAGPVTVRVGRDSLRTYVDSSRLAPGNHWTAAHYDSARAFAVTLTGVRGPRRLWIDSRGAVFAQDTPLGLRWIRTDFDLSETEFRKTLPARRDAILAAWPIVDQFAGAAILDTGSATRRFLVQHRDGSPVDHALLAMLAGGRQTVQGDTITVNGGSAAQPGESLRDTVADPMIQGGAGAIAIAMRRVMPEPFDRTHLPAILAAFRRLVRVDTTAAGAADALGTGRAHARKSAT